MQPNQNLSKTKIGLVQINNSFDNQNYLPLAVGYLWKYAEKYAKNFNDFELSTEPIYKRIKVDEAVERLSDAKMVGFSTYVWNYNISREIAKRLKQKNPDITTVFGGCHIPDSPKKGLIKVLENNPYIDIVAFGEGERVFTQLLDNYKDRNWNNVNSIVYRDKDELKVTKKVLRMDSLDEIPSPYLTGFFDNIMNNSNEEWIALFETNRGCPFTCSFCEWGTGDKAQMREFNLERILNEIEWISENDIPFVYCCDSNFGLYDRFVKEGQKGRDLTITEKFVEMKQKNGFPRRFSVQNTKNSTEASYNIQKKLVESELDQGVLLAFQSLYPPTLQAIKRANIKLDTFFELQKRFTQEGVKTFSDIILGLPLETYETFTNGVAELISRGQHNKIQFNNLSILPNAPIVEDRNQYGLETRMSKVVNIHGKLDEVEEIEEDQEVVISTNTMSKEDWLKARIFSYNCLFSHFNKTLQIPNILLNKYDNKSYKDIIGLFMDTKSEIISDIQKGFRNQALNIQNGGAEYTPSTEWLNMYWPIDELTIIDLVTKNKLDSFYKEAESLFKNNSNLEEKLIEESIHFNKELLIKPETDENKVIHLNYNLAKIYKKGLMSDITEIKKGDFPIEIVKMGRTSPDVKKWAREVIWWGNKKGNYLYNFKELHE